MNTTVTLFEPIGKPLDRDELYGWFGQYGTSGVSDVAGRKGIWRVIRDSDYETIVAHQIDFSKHGHEHTFLFRDVELAILFKLAWA